MDTKKPNLVIIGSGWAGQYILERIPLEQYNTVVLSPRRTSAYTPLLASAAVGLFNFYLAEEPVRSASRTGLKFHKANVLSVDFAAKTVQCAPAFEEDPALASEQFSVPYDHLVLAPGCMPNTFGTPGVEEHAIFIKNVSDAMRVRKTLFDLLEKASLPNVSEARARELLHVAIVGGGPTGIELTAELDDLAKNEIAATYPDVARFMSISVYEVAPHILSAYDANLHEYAARQLAARAVDVQVNTRIERVDADALHIKDHGRVPYGMLLWATGNKHVPLVDALAAAGAVKTSAKGLKRILTDDRLRVLAGAADGGGVVVPGVYALGDAADMEGLSLPTTAEVAVQKARYLVDQFRMLADDTPAAAAGAGAFATPFQYQQKQLVSYIGHHDGVIAGKGPNDPGWTGRSAWLAWRSGSLVWNRNWRSRIVIVVTWCLNRVFGKEIARM